MDLQSKREREKRMVSEMIALYCRKKHGRRDGLCPDCAALCRYAMQRRARCPARNCQPGSAGAGRVPERVRHKIPDRKSGVGGKRVTAWG